jgi:ribosomal protein S27E
MGERSHDYEVEGEVIKMIHAELPAVRWTCGGCGEDSCTIFYQPNAQNELVECESCGASNLVRKP